MGFDPPAQLKNTPDKVEYICPICVSGSTYDLLHLAIDAHKREWDTYSDASSSISLTSPQHESSGDKSHLTSPQHESSGDKSHLSSIFNGPLDTGQVDFSSSSSAPGTNATPHTRPNSETGRNTRLPELAPIHQSCGTKAKTLLASLNNDKFLTKHASTLLVGDSLVHCVNKRDFETDTLRVRSIGCLCIPAFGSALKQRERPLVSVKRLILSVGVNNYLHRENHCTDDTSHYFKAMGDETKRVFPNASVFYVLPYKGITKISAEDRKELEKLVKTNCSNFKVFAPPSLVNKVSAGGVHPKTQGAKLLVEFYRKLVPVPSRTFSRDSGRRSKSSTYATAAVQPPPQDTQPRQQRQWRHPSTPVSTTPVYVSQQTGRPPDTYPGFSGSSDNIDHLAWDIATAVVSALQQRDYRQRYTK